MSTWIGSRLLALLALALGVAVSDSAHAAPAKAPSVPSADDSAQREQVLRERAAAYWQARLERSPRVYDFYAPHEAGGPAPEAVSEGGNVAFTAFEIEDVEVRGDRATLRVRVQAHAAVPGRAAGILRTAHVHETWDFVGGHWYKRPVPPGFARRRSERPAQDPASERAASPQAPPERRDRRIEE